MNVLRPWLASLALLLSACSGEPGVDAANKTAAQGPSAEARADTAMADLGKTLRAALKEKMLEGGALTAVDFCHQQAQPLTAQISQKHGVALGRTALRIRNPANQPLPWQETVLDDFAARAAAGEAPASLRYSARDGAVYRTARGIVTEPGCLACHGKQVPEPIADAIRERYPDDHATGFAAGDLRGLIWAEVQD